MKLEKFKKNKKLRNTLLTLGITLVILGGGIIVYRTYALYQDEHKYNVIKGLIPNFDYDIRFAVNVNGEEQSNLPEDDYDVTNPNNKNIYYKVNVTCDNEVKAEWDYNAWNLKITNLDSGKTVNGTKCKLAFNDTDANGLLGMSATERDNIIKQGVQTRRNTYRGKDITEYYQDGTLYEQISSGKFDDIYVGDYFKGKSETIWLIADLDNYWHQGWKDNDDIYNATGLNSHHATIIPDGSLMNAQMNSDSTTAGGYVGSEMYKKTLDTILSTKIEPDFKDKIGESHVLEYQNLLSNDMDSTLSNMFGLENGASKNWAWYTRKLDLMSKINVYGSIVFSSSGFDIGIDNRQYAIFQLRPELINQTMDGNRYWYWLKAVISSKYFARITDCGDASYGGAYTYSASNLAGGIRPRFLIG